MKLVQMMTAVALVAATLTGCDKDFRSINTDTNVPTQVTPDLLLSGVIRNMMNQQVSDAWGIGNIVVQYHAKIQFVNEDRYLWNEQNGVWNSVYGNYRNLQNILTQVSGDNKNAYHGVALILKSWMFSLIADAYGDAPYSEAGKAKIEGLYQPKYDKQEDIYTGILADLKKANEILAASTNTISGDLLYGGGACCQFKMAQTRQLTAVAFADAVVEKEKRECRYAGHSQRCQHVSCIYEQCR
ncbi:SusD/RagB family nutrient-binding outer membrane lipoprotein [Phnomibacter ginsenosidimutans]|uniref:SusD/RagB family nutrient-binding outer membrane lipoprotein n=1 Tax=Phnomibacter ginsenosidimutans TaxID=2676868 RepID=UPI0018D25AC7|nr:SusD/RagB family nutrient-binding outer membrane lipoprotein [Phnomibacter ginsenosidimutans]